MKVVIDPDTKVATDVQFEKGGKIYFVKASKEIVLSGGSIASPQVLQLSGVCPADHLTDIGISPIIADLPVGKNMHDHVGLIGMVFLIGKI